MPGGHFRPEKALGSAKAEDSSAMHLTMEEQMASREQRFATLNAQMASLNVA